MSTEQEKKWTRDLVALFALAVATSFLGASYILTQLWIMPNYEERLNDQRTLEIAILDGYCQEKGYEKAGTIGIGIPAGDIGGYCLDSNGERHDFMWKGVAKEYIEQ